MVSTRRCGATASISHPSKHGTGIQSLSVSAHFAALDADDERVCLCTYRPIVPPSAAGPAIHAHQKTVRFPRGPSTSVRGRRRSYHAQGTNGRTSEARSSVSFVPACLLACSTSTGTSTRLCQPAIRTWRRSRSRDTMPRSPSPRPTSHVRTSHSARAALDRAARRRTIGAAILLSTGGLNSRLDKEIGRRKTLRTCYPHASLGFVVPTPTSASAAAGLT
ncbi:hypothetical protein L226DRAFT_301866 [Lentinus tigrinus ALCF2SS1-7]|uniref:Uncharacterized protein n=1 Tax=Lentinus tigrinus ALCF2SS1-6 TaxID=1328759 RepID=A0A5C2S202_9APHY|nr:hypothetical protein L227DRAFT_226484 [Lentinus tigrinus ALCF2SS1-6]RPD78765.1 hypothetical protein L226DRAFT_301866 [Lentinus tigrinus ALCF2SS1-7]